MSKLMYGLQVTVIGMGIVFIILFLLSLFMDIMRALFYREQSKPAAEQGAVTRPSASHKTKAALDQDQTQLIAVITAAVAQTLGEGSRFKVTKVRRLHTSRPIWSLAARNTQSTLTKLTRPSKERRNPS